MDRKLGLANFHTHCGLDDGLGTMEEYVLKALSKGFESLGFSCHAPGNDADSWRMKEGDFPYYLEEIARLQATYRSRIEIYAGIEYDYLEVSGTCMGSEYRDKLDYAIGAVHMMWHEPSHKYLSIDGPKEEFDSLLQDNFNNDIQAMVIHYFSLVETMIEKHSFDLLAHCDLIKKLNKEHAYFDPQSPWYKKAASHMLKIAKKHQVRVEVNTGGIARGATSEVYPSRELISECYDLGIPLVLSSDAHQSNHIDFYFSQADDQLAQIGYKTIQILRHGLWQHISIV